MKQNKKYIFFEFVYNIVSIMKISASHHLIEVYTEGAKPKAKTKPD